MTSAPAATIASAWATAWGGDRNAPPSEKLSGVTLRMPITTARCVRWDCRMSSSVTDMTIARLGARPRPKVVLTVSSGRRVRLAGFGDRVRPGLAAPGRPGTPWAAASRTALAAGPLAVQQVGHGGLVQHLALDDPADLLAAERLVLQQRLGERVDLLAVRLQQRPWCRARPRP